jgi:hypothetical protein
MNEVITRSGWAMDPADGKQAMEMAKWIAESGLVPQSFQGKPKDICVAAAMGAKLGLDVFAAMQGIAVVNGRPSLWGDVLRSLILAHPELEDLVETTEGKGDDMTATCTITRKGMTPHTERFSVADAKEAGLWGKNVWAKFSKDMLLNRAFGRAARRRFADALAGISVAEEMQDAEIVKDVEAEVVDEPKADKPPAKKAAPRKAKPKKVDQKEADKQAAEAIIKAGEAQQTVDMESNLTSSADVPSSQGVDMDVLIQVAKEARGFSDDETVQAVIVKYTGDAEKNNIADVPFDKWQDCWDDLLWISEGGE